jgi:3-hydroxybutyryl-CoA dehydrogenase
MTPVSSAQQVAICGVGQMGAAAAVSFRRCGYRVLLWSWDVGELHAAEERLNALDAWMDAHIRPAASSVGSIELMEEVAAVDARAEVVMDCIREDMDDKVELLRRFSDSRRRGALFITTTSGLSITEMGRRSGTGHLLAGTHFWNPPHLMPLVEVVRGQDTPDEIMDHACELVRSLGKVPVRVNRDVPGFIGNRLLHAMWREAIYLVQEGIASPEDVDRVARLTFGLRLPAVGPLENMDLIGLDLVRTIHQYLLESLSDAHRPLPELERKVAAGEVGMKSGSGFYDWRRRDPAKLIEQRDRQIVQQLRYLQELEHS